MEINISALNDNLNYQKTALIYFRNAGLIDEKEMKARTIEIERNIKLNNRVYRQKHLSLDASVKITEGWS